MPRESFFSVRDIFQDRRKLFIFLVCLLLASLSWVFISLGKSYSSTLVVPVKYINFPENKTLLNTVPQRLAVNVSGSGYDLLQFDQRLTEDTLIINLDNLKISVLGQYQRGYLDQAALSKDLQDLLNGTLAINRVLSDSIFFVFDLKVSRIISVKPKVRFTIAKGYTLVDSIEVVPNELEVFGALSILDTLSAIETEWTELGELSKTRKFRSAIAKKYIGSDAQTSYDSVLVIVNVDKITEKRFMLTPQLLNVPDSLEMLTFPNGIEVIAQIPLSKFDEVVEEDFQLTVDYNNLEEGYMVLPVDLESWNPIAQQITIKPQTVEIVLTRID